MSLIPILRSLGKKVCLIVLLWGVFVMNMSSQAQVRSADPLAEKIRELALEYQNKKAQGYDVNEVEETLRHIREARERGDRQEFIRLLKKAETQLKEAKSPAEQPVLPVKQAEKTSNQGAIYLDQGPWPMYCHDPQHTCRSPYEGLTEPPTKPKWKFNSPGGHGISSPTVIGSNGRVYTGTWKNDLFLKDKAKGHSGTLCALSPKGSLDWLHDSDRGSLLASAIESSPLLTSDGKIIYGKDDGHVYAVTSRGELVWDFACDDPFKPEAPYDDNEQVIPSPVIGKDGTLYVCSHWGNVYNPTVVREMSRRIPRIKELGIKPVKKPLWGKLYAINVQTGSRKWVYDPSLDSPSHKRVMWGSPAIGDDGTIYFTCYDGNSYNGYLYALNPAGIKKWRFPKNDGEKIDALQSSPSIGRDGTIYVGSFGGKNKARLFALNPDGSLKWSYEVAENRITSTPGIGPDGTIYVGAHNWGFLFNPNMSVKGHMYAIEDSRNGPKLKWKFEVEYGVLAPPAIDSRGNIFFGTDGDPLIKGKTGDFHLYALNHQGQKLWSYPLKGSVYSPPVIDRDGTIYVGTTMGDAALYAFGPKRGKE